MIRRMNIYERRSSTILTEVAATVNKIHESNLTRYQKITKAKLHIEELYLLGCYAVWLL
jgi:hypothetical protein